MTDSRPIVSIYQNAVIMHVNDFPGQVKVFNNSPPCIPLVGLLKLPFIKYKFYRLKHNEFTQLNEFWKLKFIKNNAF